MKNQNYWSDAAKNRERAIVHTKLMAKTKINEIHHAIQNAKIYDFCNLPKKEGIPSNFWIINADTVHTLVAWANNYDSNNVHHKIGVLNFASFKEPGGKFLEGSSAQEECLCHASNLYNVLQAFQASYYDVNKKCLNKGLYTNRALYTPDIEFMQGDTTVKADVITMAAPNLKVASGYCHVSREENEAALSSRITFIRNIACQNHLDTIILGAYGCGVFGQDPTVVAAKFYHAFKDMGMNVLFAVPGKDKNALAFFDYFRSRKEHGKA